MSLPAGSDGEASGIRYAPELAEMHNECAQILRLAGQPSLAEAQLLQARRLLELRITQ